MTRVPLLLLSLLTVGGLSSAALAKENNKPPAAPQSAGQTLQGIDFRPVDRETQLIGEVQEGTGIRHRQRAGQSPVAGQVQQGTAVQTPRDRPRRRRR